MEHLQHVAILDQQVEQRLQVDALGQRVDRRRFLLVGDLDQAQLGPIGVLAHELGVDRDERRLGEAVDQRGECGGVGD